MQNQGLQVGAVHSATQCEQPRSGEAQAPKFRSNRVFRSNGQWYFHTREGVDIGPFETLGEANNEVGLLVRRMGELSEECISGLIRERQLEAQVAAGTLEAQDFVSYVDESDSVPLSEFARIVKNYKAQNGRADTRAA